MNKDADEIGGINDFYDLICEMIKDELKLRAKIGTEENQKEFLENLYDEIIRTTWDQDLIDRHDYERSVLG